MAAIVLGTAQFGMPYGINNGKQLPRETVFGILDQASRLGITILDSADAYGVAQELIGSYHQSANFRFRINTKFTGVGDIREALNKTLEQSSAGKVRVCFYHSFREYRDQPALKDMLSALKEENRIEYIGVSLYTPEEMEIAIDDPQIDVIQLPFNLLDNRSRRGRLISRAKEQNKTIQVRSVFLQGLFFRDPALLPDLLMPLQPLILDIRNISRQYGLSVQELSLRYANAWDDIDEIVIGVDTPEQLVANVNAMSHPLPEEAIRAIDTIRVAETGLLYPFNWGG